MSLCLIFTSHEQGEQYYTSADFVLSITSLNLIYNSSVNKEVDIVLDFKHNIMCFYSILQKNILPLKPQQNCCTFLVSF